MGNKILLWLATFGLALQLTACTSGDEKSDVEAGDDIESLADGGDDMGDDSMMSDQLPEEALGGDVAAAPNESTAPADSSSSLMDEPASDDMALAEPPPAVTDTPAPTETSSVPAEETAPMVAASEPAEPEDMPEEKPKPAPVALQKVAAEPWKIGGQWINAVYFAKPGDTTQSISQVIYGADKSDHLKKANPVLNNREPRPGDKIYYNSPQRPDDNQKVLTWYEDNNLAPEMYTAKSGDNIRTLATQLLGYDGAWKELWSSNSVDSKGALEEGTELRFWKVASAPVAATPPADMPMEQAPPPEQAPPVAQNDFPPPPPMPEPSMNDLPPPPPDLAQNDFPPPPPVENLAPPPPPPPPPPPISAGAKETLGADGESAEALDEDTMTALGVVAMAAAGLAALLVVRRRRKQKEMEQFNDTTHVGT